MPGKLNKGCSIFSQQNYRREKAPAAACSQKAATLPFILIYALSGI